MATIEIPDSMVPAGHELTGEYGVPEAIGFDLWEPYLISGSVSQRDPMGGAFPILRRKPRLKQIVFTVAGEPRQIKAGEWRLLTDGSPCLWDGEVSDKTPGKFIPLTREEVYE